jgi:holo-[acyl-carrier protein] synthase
VVIGIGVDVVDIDRFDRALERTPALATRLFGPVDLDGLADGRARVMSLAARFAVKEATLKALGGHVAGFSWQDIQLRRLPGRAPTLDVTGGVSTRAAEMGVTDWHVSISHDGPVAVAFVVASGVLGVRHGD